MSDAGDDTLRLLLIEDNEHDAVAFRRTFRRSDVAADIVHVTRAEDAAARIDEADRPFDAVIADHHLPGQQGLDFLEDLIGRQYPAALVLLTGSGSEEVAVEALKAGIHDYLVKDPQGGYLKLIPVAMRSIVATHRERIARRQAEERMRTAAAVFDTTAEAIMITDADETIEMVNHAFTEVTGYAPEEVVGRTPKVLASGRHGPEFYAEMHRVLADTGHWRGEIWNRRKGGELYVQRLTVSAIPGPGGTVAKYVGVFSDITDVKRQQERATYQATHDPLTGLPNRALMSDRLEHGLDKTQRMGGGLAVLFIDLDGFKPVNDRYGHLVGDLLLQQVAQRLRGCVRASDTVARLGGDEFVIIALHEPGSLSEAEVVARHVLERVGEPFRIDGRTLHVGASIGIAEFPDHAREPEELIRLADEAMYAAKSTGRGRYVVAAAAAAAGEP